MSGGVYNILFSDITFDGRNNGFGVGSARIKTQRGRGGVVDGVTFQNIHGRGTGAVGMERRGGRFEICVNTVNSFMGGGGLSPCFPFLGNVAVAFKQQHANTIMVDDYIVRVIPVLRAWLLVLYLLRPGYNALYALELYEYYTGSENDPQGSDEETPKVRNIVMRNVNIDGVHRYAGRAGLSLPGVVRAVTWRPYWLSSIACVLTAK
jgi:hypothetical protein